ncbi:cathepsin B [Capsaspora owczarzaki ATCC 30864]|uniref:Cathepsin B n=1 Tax=Capsaspora owczarzaki (strain ATCC 30864) TaxID=595528 RepID=A0A0D2WXV9_CAPO3|nr:cathepsin B [Capsaspora owczarzaki ATCC 30864]
MRTFACLALLALLATAATAVPVDPIGDMVDHINSLKTTWVAERPTRFGSFDEVARLCGALETPEDQRLPLKVAPIAEAIPDTFDSRTNWPACPTIKESACGSCWAFGAVESMSDRICIASNATKIVRLSASDLLSCCTSCGDGCDGGQLGPSWDYYKNKGIVTGYLYNTTGYCKPYDFPACAHHEASPDYPDCPSTDYSTPKCTKSCVAGYTANTYTADLHYGQSSYSVGRTDAAIQTEILNHGPVEAAFTVYSDFPTYRSGVYKHTSGSVLGGHAISIVGWGTESGSPYWLVKNSWNPSWGDGGFFKILRGDCGINNDVVGGLPKLA